MSVRVAHNWQKPPATRSHQWQTSVPSSWQNPVERVPYSWQPTKPEATAVATEATDQTDLLPTSCVGMTELLRCDMQWPPVVAPQSGRGGGIVKSVADPLGAQASAAFDEQVQEAC